MGRMKWRWKINYRPPASVWGSGGASLGGANWVENGRKPARKWSKKGQPFSRVPLFVCLLAPAASPRRQECACHMDTQPLGAQPREEAAKILIN